MLNEDLIIAEGDVIGVKDVTQQLSIIDPPTARSSSQPLQNPPMTATHIEEVEDMIEYEDERGNIELAPSGITALESVNESLSNALDRMSILNISDSRIDNFKSPMFLKLETMISTLDKFRSEMDGSRVPKYEKHFIAKRR